MKICPFTHKKESIFWNDMDILYAIDAESNWNMLPNYGEFCFLFIYLLFLYNKIKLLCSIVIDFAIDIYQL